MTDRKLVGEEIPVRVALAMRAATNDSDHQARRPLSALATRVVTR